MSRPSGQQWWRRGGVVLLFAVSITTLSAAAGLQGSGAASAKEPVAAPGSASSKPTKLTLKVKPHKVRETMATGVTAVLSLHDGKFAAAEPVVVSSQQLQSVCPDGVTYTNGTVSQANSIQVDLDKNGNGSATVTSPECAPGSFTVLANLQEPPYDTAKATIHVYTVKPPKVTTIQVSPNPVAQTATIDEQVSIESPRALESVTVSSAQLRSSCQSLTFTTPDGTTSANTVTETVNIDYQASVTLLATDCQVGNSTITADILSPPYDSANTELQIESPPS